MSLEGSASDTADSQTKTSVSYATDASESRVAGTTNSYPGVEEESDVVNLETNKLQEPADVGTVPKRAAKIHDFCFGIPFGKSPIGLDPPLPFLLYHRQVSCFQQLAFEVISQTGLIGLFLGLSPEKEMDLRTLQNKCFLPC